MFFQAHKQLGWEKSSQQALRQWFSSPLGQQLFLAERALSHELLRSIPSRYSVQYGASAGSLLLSECVTRGLHLDHDPQAPALEVLATPDALPLANDSVDLLLLVHVLECYSAGPPLWAEVQRVVRANGHVLLVGFNPYSLWALRQHWRQPPAYLRYAPSAMTVQRHLHAYGLQPLALRYVLPPSVSASRWTCWAHHGPLVGWSYMCLARKQVLPLTPLGWIKRWPREWLTDPAVSRACSRRLRL